jgi:xanthine dehydrogenase accessory factor
MLKSNREERIAIILMTLQVLIRGGGDLSSGVTVRLFHAGLRLIIIELDQPLSVRRLVSFSEAIYQKIITIEGITARQAVNIPDALKIQNQGDLPVLIDPEAKILYELKHNHKSTPLIVVDGRMTKRPPDENLAEATFLIGLGPGFVAGENCHAAIETNRGHNLGRVIWQGAPQADTGIPEMVINRRNKRVLRSPADGTLFTHADIGDHLEPDQLIAEVNGQPVLAPFSGTLRGLLHPGVKVWCGLKIGDVDPRDDPRYCKTVSDKSLAIGGGVLEAILSQPNLRPFLWD